MREILIKTLNHIKLFSIDYLFTPANKAIRIDKQFTGLYDSNDEEIWEGDKIRIQSTVIEDLGYIGIVVWREDYAAFAIENIELANWEVYPRFFSEIVGREALLTITKV
jgi:hypothetical protein